MINFLVSHIPNMCSIKRPSENDVYFQWDSQHEAALTKIKEVISSSLVLCQATIQVDTSKHGLGAYLLQQGKPIAYAS